ncbi:phosphopantetheine-binding protein [Streptomyces sp. NPDC002073]|uniref:phosphopantetheine-binding protein n=1 Tax=Streptomyces sp. NBC_00239 TaxID=2903640 RepID=UPI002E283FA5|nr:phosphopantetheine-binding protein [Streptomyces sp. NBC_00239]
MTDDTAQSAHGTANGTLGHLPALRDLRAMSPELRTATLAHCLRLHLDQLLQVPPGHRTGPHQPLRNQGLDLLNAESLVRGIQRDLSVPLAAEDLLDGTVTGLAELLAKHLEPAPAGV